MKKTISKTEDKLPEIVEKLSSLINNNLIKDFAVKERIDSYYKELTGTKEADQILKLFQEVRPKFYKVWQLEVASRYF